MSDRNYLEFKTALQYCVGPTGQIGLLMPKM